ncbi:iron-containing alcohol dehydrogenase [Vibrio parahaemolyticus]|uniref:iron-containing alcohol dehydrogenase n=1 Tax=Vibrio parahaemolyticus TaxID=670 RepID=UPI000870CF18|nr:iron-containing alcohol dehydrogenase [Vibrio parahaemolyticus]AOV91870.1 Lactaldehyde reductase [Vibrio parahaemolyticus]EJL6385174.1 iron-containing alcohol dehydrogenase [Vibrio parahaemolyticus]MCR9977525.1 iron-containing alcohol dehydrogenase [Vibrio parahaemolyticus]HCG5946402.1 iron-containing alcohol dehydrogenase [Vibrio parahaemolyticus]HCG5951497.1 iron-containing alcohol dehydrogenase [Vibrio parahaemolyticus]
MSVFKLAFPKINYSGVGAIEALVERLVQEHGNESGLLICDPMLVELGFADKLLGSPLNLTLFKDVRPNPDTDTVNNAYAAFNAAKAQFIIGFGGGSSIDTAKAVKILSANPAPIANYNGVEKVERLGLPLYAINTTAGTAAEVTSNAVITDTATHVKHVIISDKIIPEISVNDASVMLGIPKDTTAATGIDALTHAVESFVSVGAHTLTDYISLEAIKTIAEALPAAVDDGSDVNAREKMAYGQFIAGLSFNSAGLGMVHAMAHPAGAHKDLPHGVCNAILLPIVSEFNRPYRVEKFAKVAEALGVNTSEMTPEEASVAAIDALNALNRRVGIPEGFASLGVTEADTLTWVDDALADPCAGGNPQAMTSEQVIELYKKAL